MLYRASINIIFNKATTQFISILNILNISD